MGFFFHVTWLLAISIPVPRCRKKSSENYNFYFLLLRYFFQLTKLAQQLGKSSFMQGSAKKRFDTNSDLWNSFPERNRTITQKIHFAFTVILVEPQFLHSNAFTRKKHKNILALPPRGKVIWRRDWVQQGKSQVLRSFGSRNLSCQTIYHSDWRLEVGFA